MHRAYMAAIVGLAFIVAACSQEAEQKAAATAVASEKGLPGVWAIDVVDAQNTILSRHRVCDDGTRSPILAASLPMVGEATCVLADPAMVVGAEALTAKCKAGETEYAVATDPVGDLDRTFTLDVTMTAAGQPELKQVARTRRVAECPADWAPGDMAVAGTGAVTNLFTGETKTATSIN